MKDDEMMRTPPKEMREDAKELLQIEVDNLLRQAIVGSHTCRDGVELHTSGEFKPGKALIRIRLSLEWGAS